MSFQGLYPESHGIVNTIMYDPVMKKTFSTSGEESKNNKWWLGQPVGNVL